MALMTVALLLGGLALLVAGAEILVRGASRLAAAIGISPLVIGLTVVAFSTSSPELAVSAQAALAGRSGADIALGNVVGSNIFNVLVILGLSASLTPLVVAQRLVRWDVPIMIGVSAVTLALAWDGSLSRLDGLVLGAGMLAYTVFVVRQGRNESPAVEQEYAIEYSARPRGSAPIALNAAFVAAGLALLVVGSDWFTSGAISVARSLGVNELIIGLTVVAAGTAMPELATSVVATLKGERDIAVGNVVGSNILNLLAVLGLASILAPDGITVARAALDFHLPVMIAVAVACLPVFFTGYRIARGDGLLFLGYYLAYLAYLILAAARHDALPAFSAAMLYFVIPLTVISLAVSVGRAWRLAPA